MKIARGWWIGIMTAIIDVMMVVFFGVLALLALGGLFVASRLEPDHPIALRAFLLIVCVSSGCRCSLAVMRALDR